VEACIGRNCIRRAGRFEKSLGSPHDQIGLIDSQIRHITNKSHMSRAGGVNPRRLQSQVVKEPDRTHPGDKRMKSVCASRADSQVKVDLRWGQKLHAGTVQWQKPGVKRASLL
jgi:hypothetical protein